jgi:LacI family transcriptional regulator
MAGIKELARECGVSVATVSRALNGHPEVSDATRRLVREAAERNGYRPSQSARALVRGRSDTIGLLWDTGYEGDGRRHPFLLALLVGVKRALSSAGRHLLLLNVDEHGPHERAYIEAAHQHQLDGMILMGVDENEPRFKALHASGFPCVAFDLALSGPYSSYVTSDNFAGAVAAVRHLYSLGHHRVATITGPQSLLPSAARLAGFQAAAAELDLKVLPGYVETGDFFIDSGYACGQRLASLPEPPTAVFAAGDEMAIGAMHAFTDAGLSVPEDISVIGFDDVELAALVRPALTTIAQDWQIMGGSAVDVLLHLVEQRAVVASAGSAAQDVAAEQDIAIRRPGRVVPTRLVLRDSCRAPRA